MNFDTVVFRKCLTAMMIHSFLGQVVGVSNMEVKGVVARHHTFI